MGTGSTRVVVAMSGGVDSSAAAGLLVERGYDVIGLMMRLWTEDDGCGGRHNRCCTPDQMADARRVADRLGIPFYVVDMRATFKASVVDPFIDAYAAGLTPNPCLNCNRHIRFGALLKQAQAMDAAYLATGHYARIRQSEDGAYQLLKGLDPAKDQSYVLSVMTQRQLAQVLFPAGDYTKEHIRQIAADLGLHIARKPESQDLCFLADGDYRGFLARHAPGSATPGPIVNTQGERLGTHTGLPHYTVGQRKGLGLSAPTPLYVVGADVAANTLIVGARDVLGRDALVARHVNWVAGAPPDGPVRAGVKIRYRARETAATVTPDGATTARVKFDAPLRDITPGQAAVFYQGDVCLGGGVIARQPA
ncbi:MAG: tRNA 2-thiouridine(34) synthase MnmA [Anaerolineae bacterium]|nr:tRNA 2-thiouridine(34) synthase MnmA [Anaerolineae bacterium]